MTPFAEAQAHLHKGKAIHSSQMELLSCMRALVKAAHKISCMSSLLLLQAIWWELVERQLEGVKKFCFLVGREDLAVLLICAAEQ